MAPVVPWIAALLLASSVDVPAALERLSAPTLEQRRAAQRELSATLEPDDYDLVRARAASGDAEVYRRLLFALAGEDRHLGLAVRLACEQDGQLAALGRDALGELIARWSPGCTRIGLGRSETIAKLHAQERFDRPLTCAAYGALDLEEALDALMRATPGALPLVLDPDLRDSGAGAVEAIEGTFDRALAELVRTRKLGLEGFGLDDDLEDRAQPWLRIGAGGSEAQHSGTELLVAWCAGSSGAEIGTRRSACARALAASAWPAAIGWLEERWLRGQDEAALDGLLLAAGRGHVARSFARADRWRDLEERMRAESARRTSAGDRRALAIARALGAAGASGLGGEDLAALALEGWASLAPRELWLRLVVLEGSARASVAAQERVRALLGDRAGAQVAGLAALAPGSLALSMLRLQALRVLAEQRSAPVELGLDARATRAWLASLARAGRLEEAIERLVDQAIRPPAELVPAADETPQARDESPQAQSARRAALEWTVLVADPEAGARALAAALAGDPDREREIEALAERFLPRVRAGDGGPLVAAVRGARAVQGARDIVLGEDLELLAALSGAGDLGRTLDAALAPSRGMARRDLLVLGALAAGPRGGDARDALLRALAGPAAIEDLVAALDRAIVELRAARLETEERSFVAAIRAAVRESDPARRAPLRVDAWPAEPRPQPIDLFAFDRSLARAGL